MRRFNSLFALDRLSVLQRVAGGMGIILLLLAGLSVNSWRTITEVYNKADYVEFERDRSRGNDRICRPGERNTYAGHPIRAFRK